MPRNFPQTRVAPLDIWRVASAFLVAKLLCSFRGDDSILNHDSCTGQLFAQKELIISMVAILSRFSAIR